MTSPEELKIVSIGTYIDLMDAEFAKMTLDAAGIKCYLDGANTGNMLWHLNAVAGIKLIVKEQDSEKALEILADATKSEDEINGD